MDKLNLIRKHYQEATADLEELEDLWNLVKDYRLEDSLVHFAYKAAARALQAKDSWVPHKKWSYIKEAMQMFQEAIEQAPKHIEIRFLRLTVQHNTPELLDLSENIEEDIQSIQEHLPEFKTFDLDEDQALFILKFMEKSERLDSAIIADLKKRISIPPRNS